MKFFIVFSSGYQLDGGQIGVTRSRQLLRKLCLWVLYREGCVGKDVLFLCSSIFWTGLNGFFTWNIRQRKSSILLSYGEFFAGQGMGCKLITTSAGSSPRGFTCHRVRCAESHWIWLICFVVFISRSFFFCRVVKIHVCVYCAYLYFLFFFYSSACIY